MCETEGAGAGEVGRARRAENGRFPGGCAGPADRPHDLPENPLRSRGQSGGTHLVHEFLRAARVQVAPQQPTDLGWLGIELLD
jgi:hypothetical protein